MKRPPITERIVHKRFLSLLEVSIGLALTALLLTSLFSSFRHLIQANVKIQNAHNERHWTFITQLRLGQIFETLEDAHEEKNFFMHDRGIRFVFNNGVDREANFCEKIQGVLLCEENCFCLVLIGHDGKTRKEIFKKNVQELHFRFYDLNHGWVTEWTQKDLPPIIQIQVEKESFYFSIPKADQTLVIS